MLLRFGLRRNGGKLLVLCLWDSLVIDGLNVLTLRGWVECCVLWLVCVVVIVRVGMFDGVEMVVTNSAYPTRLPWQGLPQSSTLTPHTQTNPFYIINS